MEMMLQTQNLCKYFRKQKAVNNVSLNIEKGQIYGLLGPNGAGKSTTLKMLTGMMKPTAGKIYFDGKPWNRKDLSKIGALIENPPIYENLSARENLKVRQLLLGIDENRIDEVLQLVSLANTGKKKAGQFSLGMKQRLGIAMALLGEPELLILDEPTNGLDPIGIEELRELQGVGRGAGLECAAAQQGSPRSLHALCAVGDLLLALNAAGAGNDRKVSAADLYAVHIDHAVVRVELAVGLLIRLGHAAAGLHHRVCQHPALGHGLGVADQAQNVALTALGIVDLQAHILQFVAELAYLYLRCVLFEYDDHSALSPLPYRVKRRGRPAPLPQLAVSNFRVLKCVTL